MALGTLDSDAVGKRAGRSGRAVGAVVAPSGLSRRDSRSGARRHSLEVLPSGSGCRVYGVVANVVVIELALVAVGHQVKDA